MSLPSKAEVYERLSHHLRLAQEDAAMLQHLYAAEGDGPGMVLARGWHNVQEMLKRMIHTCMMLKMGKLS
jgi:hypothetical protein